MALQEDKRKGKHCYGGCNKYQHRGGPGEKKDGKLKQTRMRIEIAYGGSFWARFTFIWLSI